MSTVPSINSVQHLNSLMMSAIDSGDFDEVVRIRALIRTLEEHPAAMPAARYRPATGLACKCLLVGLIQQKQ